MYSAADGSASPSADGFKRADLGSHPHDSVRRAPHFLAMALQAARARDMSTSACLLRGLLLAWSVAYRAPNSDLVFLFCRCFGVSVLLSWCWHWSRF